MRNRTKWILGTLIIVLGVSVYFNYFTPTKESYIEDQPLTEKFKTKMALATGYHYQLKPLIKRKPIKSLSKCPIMKRAGISEKAMYNTYRLKRPVNSP